MTVVDLARAPDFRLGDVWVRPARRQVVQDGGRTEVLQPRVMQVLLVLAEADGAVVTREELTRACWSGSVVGEDAVNRVISHLRRLAETLGEGSFRIETIPKVGYRLDCAAPRLAASPAETPPASAHYAGSLLAEPVQHPRRRFWSRSPTVAAIVALVALVGIGLGLWKAGMRWPGSAGEGPQVAIAPFEAIGAGDAARETAKAVASDVLGELGAHAVQTVAVASVSSAPSSVHLVLNGEVQQTRADARVTLHLFDPKARAILWSGEVTDDPTSPAVLQRQASAKAADMLICGLDAFAPKAQLDSQARALWLRTCDTWRQRGTLGQARDAMRVLMERAPRFSGGYARYALATARMIPYGVVAGSRAARDQARGAALHALRLNADEADAYVALSLTEPDTDWLAQEQWLSKGLAHQPNSSDLISWQADLLARLGRTGEALALARRGVELDPLSTVKTVVLADWLYFAGKTSEAARFEQEARQTWPRSPDLLSHEFERAIRNDDAPKVLGMLSDPRTRPVEMSDAEAQLWPTIMAERRGTSSMRFVVARQISDLVERGRFNDFSAALALHVLDEDDVAYDLMLKLSKGRNDVVNPVDIAPVLFQPEMSNLRRQPRFMVLAANLGLTAYWRRSGRWPDFCSEPDLGYSCLVQARVAERARERR